MLSAGNATSSPWLGCQIGASLEKTTVEVERDLRSTAGQRHDGHDGEAERRARRLLMQVMMSRPRPRLLRRVLEAGYNARMMAASP